MQSGFRYAMAEDMKPGAKLYRGNITGAKIEQDPITINTVDRETASYTGTSGNLGKGRFMSDEEGVIMSFGNGRFALFVNEIEHKYGSTHGLGRSRKSRRKVRKTRRYRRKTDSFKTKS